MRSNVIPFPAPYTMNPYAGYGYVAPSGEEYSDWVPQVFMTDAAFSDEEVDAAMDRAWADAVSRGLVQSNYFFAGVEAFKDESTGLWGVMVYYYVPPEHAIEERKPGYQKKGWPWYAWAGIGLGAVAVITTVVLVATSKKSRRRRRS